MHGRHLRRITLIGLFAARFISASLWAQKLDQLLAHNVSLKNVTYRGREAVQLIASPNADNGSSYATIKNSAFESGTIEVDVAGKPVEGAGAQARGFIGIAFRLQDKQYEYIYLRPTNGRSEDQVRRNHSTQYGSHPDFDYARLRRDSPEKYESYVDLEPGVWTRFRLEIEGRKAQLYVHDAQEPALVVNDLKLALRQGQIALWVGPGTEGYFAHLRVRAKHEHPLLDAASKKVYFDMAHGEALWPPGMADIGQRIGFRLEPGNGLMTAEALAGNQLLYLRAPNKAFDISEKQVIMSYVKAGGSLLVVLDEEQRQKLAVVGINDVIESFGLKLSGDTPHLENTGAIAKAGEIHAADREIPYDGGREVFGGTPFAYQLNREGKLGQPSAAYTRLDNGARIVVMGEGMASLLLGDPGAKRLSVERENPQWWGKDSSIFMEEVFRWLLAQ